MKKALISPEEGIQYISSFEWNQTNWIPTFSKLENGQRIAQVEEQPFPVAIPLHWVDCPDNCTSTDWYFNGSTCLEIPHTPLPAIPENVAPNVLS